jgi:hypothetical protein
MSSSHSTCHRIVHLNMYLCNKKTSILNFSVHSSTRLIDYTILNNTQKEQTGHGVLNIYNKLDVVDEEERDSGIVHDSEVAELPKQVMM